MLKEIFCFHKYTKQAIKVNFYGSALLLKCSKCKNEKVDVVGWPEMGLPSKTKYTHFN